MKKLAGKRLAVIAGGLSVVLVAGVAFAAWTASGTGNGYAKAISAQALTTVDVHASTVADLYPGFDGVLLVKINNPNPYPVRVTSITSNGTITSDNATCDTNGNGVSFAGLSGAALVTANGGSNVDIAANTATSFTLTGAVHMSNSSDTHCQGATFTVPVSLSGASNA